MKKPAFWTLLASVVICIVVAVCFLTNPKKEKSSEDGKMIEDNRSDTQNSKADGTILKSAPAMEVLYNDQKISVSSGSYSWYMPDENGQIQGQEADGIHPLEQSYEKTTISLSPDIEIHSIELLFPVMPDEIKVLGYWSADNIGKSWEEWDKQTPYQVTVDFKDMNWMAARDDGDFVYEIMASWDKEEFQGTAYYSFMTESSLTAEQSMMAPGLENVTLYFEKYSATGGDIEIANFSDKELQCGQEYYLMVYRDGTWEDLEQTAEGAWDDIAYGLPQGETTILPTDFTYLYGTLESGKYRIVKRIMDWRAPGDYTEYELYCDFTIG